MLLLMMVAGPAAAALTASPLTWNVVGLDSNDVNTGPANFPIGYRICASGTASNGVATVTWNWSSSNAFVNLRTGSAGGPGGPALTVGPLASGACEDAYFDLAITRNASAYATTRSYSLTVDDADPGSLVTPTREVFVERLVSQNRNFITSIRVGTSLGTLTPATLGTSTQLLTGQTYYIELTGGTATQGYEQLATFASFANTVFRVMSVNTTFNADSSSYTSSPASSLYLDGCLWENDPTSPAYRSCLDVGKAGGSTVVVLYQVQILSGAGTSERLSTLFYDYSGSSYHYNADFGTDGLQLNILDPTQNSTIAKQFIPSSIPQGTESTLRITINNQNTFSVSGYAVTDNLPSGVVLASTPAASTSGCGTPTVTATAGASSVTISNATIAASSSCTLTVKVSASTAGTYNNTIAAGQFTINGVSTGQSASATLTVTTAPAAPSGCTPGATLAQWTFQGLATGDNYAPTASMALVSPATATAGGDYVGSGGTSGAHTTIGTGSPVTDLEWDIDHVTVGASLVHAQQEFMQFAINTTGYASLNLSYEMDRSTNGPQTMSLFIDSSATPPVSGAGVTTNAVPSSHTVFSNTYSTEINKTGTTYFRFYFYNSGIDNNGHYASLNDVTFTACGFPTLAKAFNPATTVPNQTSTLTFTVVNPNPSNSLSGIAFTDSLPVGVVVATPNGVTNNGNCGAPSVTAAAGGSDISVSGGTIAGGATCTISVNVVAATAGARVNVSGQVSSTQTGTNTTSTGSGTATLTTVNPPTMTKVFAPNPVAVSSTSAMTLTVTNPNSVGSMGSVGFTDTFPAGMTVAATPAASNTCGGTFSPVAAAGSVTLSGATLAAGATCTLTVNVTTGSAGVRTNSVAASHVLNATTYTGPTAAANLTSLAPSLSLQKQIGLGPTGPWSSNVQVATGTAVHYRFVVENTGLVALSGVSITDSLLPGASMAACNATISSPLPVADLLDEDHIDSCVVGPVVAGASTTTNTASAASTTPATTSNNASATYTIVTNLPQLKAIKTLVSPTPPIAFGANATYQIVVRNQGLAATTGTIFLYDDLLANLTFLSYSGTGWVCNGSDPLSCSYTGASLAAATTLGGVDGGVTAALQVVVRVENGAVSADNTARAIGGGDGRCPTLSFSANADCISSVLAGTLPVTLSDVEVAVESGMLAVRFGTASELGSLQYRVYSDAAGRASARVLLGSTDAAGTSLSARRYQVAASYSGQTQVWIEEEAIDGKKERYGPYPIGLKTGERDLSTPIDWSQVGAEQRSFRQNQARATLTRTPAGELQVEVGVASRGLVVITHEQLLGAGIDWTGQLANRVRLYLGPQPVDYVYQGPAQFGPGSRLSFIGKEVTGSRYTRTRAYRLSLAAAAGPTAPTQYARPGSLPAAQTAPGTLVHAPKRLYDMSSAQADPWTALRMIRNNTPLTSYSETFTIDDRAATSVDEVLVVDLHGGVDQPQSPDHSVRLYLNGQLISQRLFDGLTTETATVLLPGGLLRQGSNTLRMDMVGDTGASASVVYLDAIEARYVRELRAVNDRLELPLPSGGTALAVGDRIHADNFDDLGVAACTPANGCGAYTVRGFSQPDVRIVHERADGSIAELSGLRVTAQADRTYSVSFAVPHAGGTVWTGLAQTGINVTLAPRSAPRPPVGTQPADYLIIAHPSFVDGLAPLVAARRADGFDVQVVNVEDVYAAYTDGVLDPAAVSAVIADAFRLLGTRYVLLVGGDTYDYFDYTGAHSQSFVPTYYRVIGPIVRHTPTDVPYADVDGDGLQDVAIGRLPVRTQSELTLWLGKLQTYNSGSYGGRLLRVSDRRLGGVDYGAELGALNFSLTGYVTTRIALDDYAAGSTGVAQARSDLADAIAAGQSLTAFLGHSSPSSWSRESLLTASQVLNGLLANSTRPTVAWVLGCYGGYAVDPVFNNVAPALMVQPGGAGAVAVIGTSALTSTSSDVAWMNAMRPFLTTERLGDALMKAQRRLREHGSLYEDAVASGMLLGDPAMRLR